MSQYKIYMVTVQKSSLKVSYQFERNLCYRNCQEKKNV